MIDAVAIDHLHKTFKNGKTMVRAVDGLTFTVPERTVYGFLGHNGAGKSTTIRMMLGLAAPTAGEVRLFGQPVTQAGSLLRKRVGGFVDSATFYPFLSGRANLEVLARTAGCFQPGRINALLERVGMAEYAERPVRGYSTGMKQRLGIAAALLNDPDLVILDEPTNGLDPSGIQAMRSLIRELADRDGKTVLLSSHLLHEVEQTCDHVAIVHRGKLVSAGAVNDLLAGGAQIKFAARPLDRAAALLAADYAVNHDETWLYVQAADDETPALLRRMLAAQIDVFQVMPHRLTLEEYFLNVVHNETNPMAETEVAYA
ncbi:MAG: ABC transporter ATP-binding protein [Anaerolineae bacterium]|nr:ABC transporter ATP-binding protein [Anaerolineae bacterium]